MRASSEYLFWSTLPKSLEQHERAVASIKAITKTSQNRDLLEFIENLLERIEFKQHYNAPSLYDILCKEHLKEVINYIASLEVVPLPVNPPKGSFAAVTPCDARHAACLKLLNNVCAHYKDNCPLFYHANSLLQTSLTIYQDTENVKVDNRKNIQGTCCVIA